MIYTENCQFSIFNSSLKFNGEVVKLNTQHYNLAMLKKLLLWCVTSIIQIYTKIQHQTKNSIIDKNFIHIVKVHIV